MLMKSLAQCLAHVMLSINDAFISNKDLSLLTLTNIDSFSTIPKISYILKMEENKTLQCQRIII